VLGIALVVVVGALPPVREALASTLDWVRAAGPAGVAVFAAVYVVATVLALPGSVLTAGAGAIWGPAYGLLLCSPTSVIAATVAFGLARTALRGIVERQVRADKRFAALDDAIGDSGLGVVLLLRLSPIFPYNLLNYALGVTRVKTWHYIAGSFVGMLPGTAVVVWLGSLAGTATSGHLGPKIALGVVGVAATAAALVVVGRIARKKLESTG
jgi:uncharacterized membrane protein YdjX (TVP38/TMEM64 family)